MLMVNLQEIRQKLVKQREVLLTRLKSQETTDQVGGIANPDRADLAHIYRQQNRDKLLLARAEQQLTEVEQALRRLEAGSYGECAQCGEPIQPERLEVMPTAALCIQCQQHEEHQNH